MELLFVFALIFNINATVFSSDFVENKVEFASYVESEWEEDLQGDITIVMDDLIAKADTQDPTDVITGFRVYNLFTLQLLYENTACNASSCDYDLSALASATYYVEADSSNGKQFRGTLTVQ